MCQAYVSSPVIYALKANSENSGIDSSEVGLKCTQPWHLTLGVFLMEIKNTHKLSVTAQVFLIPNCIHKADT